MLVAVERQRAQHSVWNILYKNVKGKKLSRFEL